jgi:hypothetical protein
VFISRSRRGGRLTVWKVGILFLGAGIWVAGVMAENFQMTAAAIIVVAIGLILSLVERGVEARQRGGDEEDVDEGDVDGRRGDGSGRDGANDPAANRWDGETGDDEPWRRGG